MYGREAKCMKVEVLGFLDFGFFRFWFFRFWLLVFLILVFFSQKPKLIILTLIFVHHLDAIIHTIVFFNDWHEAEAIVILLWSWNDMKLNVLAHLSLCSSCACEKSNSQRFDCDQESGQCVCKKGYVGRKCNINLIMPS